MMNVLQNQWICQRMNVLLSDSNISFLIHVLRSSFHSLFFITGLMYSFYQPLFLNVEVWTFIYCVSGVALVIDTFIFLSNKKFNHWMLVHLLDALFIAFILYKTGYVFFTFFYSAWLVSIMLTGWQFRLKGALLQGIWISLLFSWVQILSPHFTKMSSVFFFINTFLLFMTVGFSAWIGYRSNFFKHLARFILSPVLKSLHELESSPKQSTQSIHEDTSKEYSAWDVFFSEKGFAYKNADLEIVNMNLLIQETLNDLSTKQQLPISSIGSQLKSCHEVLIHKKKFKVALMHLMKLFTHADGLRSFDIKTYDKKKWVVIEFNGEEQAKGNPFWLFNSVSYLLFVQKVIYEHKGRLFSNKKTLSIYLPLGHHSQKKSVSFVS